MTTVPAIVAVVVTLALGVAVGLLYLQRARRHRLATAHLAAGLAGVMLVAVLFATTPARTVGGPPAVLPLLMLAAAVSFGWFAPRIKGIRRRGSELMLAAHIVVGVAGFFVLLAWVKTL